MSVKSLLSGLLGLLMATLAAASAQAADPIKIGFGMSLSGKLAANGKMALVAMQIWEDDVNAAGGLLDRPVKLVFYDDQSNPTQVPSIYAKLLDIDKVDLIISGYASTQIAAAMPIAIERKKLLMGLSGTGINEAFQYPMYFSMIPTGPHPKPAFTRGFFKVAEAQKPRPQTIALAYADAEFGQNVCEGARENAKAFRPHHRLRQELSADDGRFRAGGARDRGAQSGPVGNLLLSARYRRHDQGHPRARLQAENVGRRHGRPAVDRAQDPVGAAPQRHRQFRDLDAGQGDRIRRKRPRCSTNTGRAPRTPRPTRSRSFR